MSQVYQQPQKKANTNMIVCGVIALVVICGGAFVLLGGLGALAFLTGDTSGIALSVSAPGSVEVGENFQITLDIENKGSTALAVDSIQLPQSVLDTADLVQINAKVQQTGQDKAAFTVDLNIEPGAKKTVVFDLRAVEKGAIAGDVSVRADTLTADAALSINVQEVAAALPTAAATAAPPSTAPVGNTKIPYGSVVQIVAIVNLDGNSEPGWTGSGSIISPDGLILTNAHVVLSEGAYQVEDLVVSLTVAQDEPPAPTYLARVMQADAALDIAVLQIETDLDGNSVDKTTLNLPTVPLGNSDVLSLGDSLTIIGYPGIGGETITLTRGEVSGFTGDREYGNRSFIKTSATIAGGNSGGMAADDQGQLIGVPTQVGYGGQGDIVDCRALADTNGDQVLDNQDTCIPTGGFINALRPIKLAMPYIEAARRGEVNIQQGVVAQASSEPEHPRTALFEDDFSDPNSGWDDTAAENGSAHYVDGEYWLEVIPENYLFWSTISEEYRNVIVSVDVRIQNPSGTGDFGIVCNYQDKDNYHALEMSEDGYFAIWRQQDGEQTFLHEWEYYDLVPQGQSVNLTAGCANGKLVLAIQGAIVAEVEDDTFTSGGLGLVAGTYEVGGIVAAFDNFAVYKP